MVKEFGCEHCGHKIEAFPPDDSHSIFSLTKTKEDCIKTTYKCEDCHAEIIRYWCTKDPRMIFGIGAKDPYDGY